MKISIITINYNNALGLKKTIESVVNQACKDYEYIIIDGGSTDGSVDIIKQYSSHITYWISEKDDGIYNAMNKGIKIATGDYCNFMNSGDCYFNGDVVERILTKLDNTDIIVGKVYMPTIKRWWKQRAKLSVFDFYTYSINHQGAFIKTKLLKELYYDETYKICSDWKFFLEAIVVKNYSYKIIETEIACFGIDGIGISSNLNQVRLEKGMIFRDLFPELIVKDIELAAPWKRDLDMLEPYKDSVYCRIIIWVTIKLLTSIFSLFLRKK